MTRRSGSDSMRALRAGRPLWLDLNSHRPAQSYPLLVGHHGSRRGDRRGRHDRQHDRGDVRGRRCACGARRSCVDRPREYGGEHGVAAARARPRLGGSGRRYGARRARRIWQLSSAAARDFVRMIRRLDVDCGLTAQDAVYYAARTDTVQLKAEFRRQADGWLRRRLAVTWRPAPTDSDYSAWCDPDAAQCAIRPLQGVSRLVRSAVAAGAMVFERSPVKRIEHLRGQVRIVTPEGTLRANQVVIATGYATPRFQPPVGMFRLHHTYVLATQPLSRQGKTGTWPGRCDAVGYGAAVSLRALDRRSASPDRWSRSPARVWQAPRCRLYSGHARATVVFRATFSRAG